MLRFYDELFMLAIVCRQRDSTVRLHTKRNRCKATRPLFQRRHSLHLRILPMYLGRRRMRMLASEVRENPCRYVHTGGTLEVSASSLEMKLSQAHSRIWFQIKLERRPLFRNSCLQKASLGFKVQLSSTVQEVQILISDSYRFFMLCLRFVRS